MDYFYIVLLLLLIIVIFQTGTVETYWQPIHTPS